MKQKQNHLKNNKGRKIFWPLLFFAAGFVLYGGYEPESYIVVLDPGHGGRDLLPKSVYGDKYDPLIGEYRDHFRPGAQHKGIIESEEAYSIAEQTYEILELTHTEKGRKEFEEILKKHSNFSGSINWENQKPIKVYLSRVANYSKNYDFKKTDINAPYRLYDFPDIYTGETQKGTISRINDLNPHLVVSLHFTSGRKEKYGALASVVTPGYDTYKMALDYVRTKSTSQKQKLRRKFFASPYANWMVTNDSRTHFQWFLCDAWIYFTGFWSKKDGLSADKKKFRGYRHNMVHWAYSDSGDWVETAKKHPSDSAYSLNLNDFIPEGPFCEREKDVPERWRRTEGEEGYGGDNLYASQELLRYVRNGMIANKVNSKKTAPEILNPYLSTWSVPTYLNAISAYLELGFLDNKYDRERLLKHKKVYAESLAVGIYSLFYSLDSKANSADDLSPKGKRINFEKYENYNQENYFKKVSSQIN